jgi:hypothetical protein
MLLALRALVHGQTVTVDPSLVAQLLRYWTSPWPIPTQLVFSISPTIGHSQASLLLQHRKHLL